ncbi:MAG TPA: dipeptidase [Pirellulales bacterium]|jgi:succinyl-diaminopimelate desuccinylase|nr:dipeptidase [Pirellulales bacterium]
MNTLNEYLVQHAAQFEEDLCELLRIDSVSADRTRRPAVRRAAEWVKGQFDGLGLTTELIETAGHPLVYAESPPVAGAPTVLVYGHYDVQPPDPLDQWISPPFEPTRRAGNLYARGATDDKGQMLTHIKSAEAYLKTSGKLPIQLKYLIEGEEEVGSDNLDPFIHKNKSRLACDVVVISDCSQFAPNKPAITYGLRGLCYYELQLTGPNQDLHSGTFGGGVTNPANALCQILAALRDAKGRVTLPGFYDDVIKLTKRERDNFAKLPFHERAFMKQLGVKGLSGEQGFSTLERRWARPTCDINGLTSGFQGEGPKTILPAQASAKFSFRLVPDQQPKKITAALKKFIRERCPAGVTWKLLEFGGSPGVVVPLESPYIAAASRAIEHGFGKKPVFMREGGSIPVVRTFHEELDVDTLLLGWGLDDDNTHSPNEKFSLADFHRGIKSSAWLWQELAAIKPT